MKRGMKLFDVFGIPMYLHGTFFLVPVLLFFPDMRGWLYYMPIVFPLITLHELCHSLMARRFGIDVVDITLYPIGGVASLSRMPETPKQEFLITAVGPLFNIVLAAGIVLFLNNPSFDAVYRNGVFVRPNSFYLLNKIAVVNIVLAIFNLIPAFPMDGGRILRSLLAMRFGHRKATQIAATLGQFFAVLFCVLGFKDGHISLFFIGLFIYSAASAEKRRIMIKEAMKSNRNGGVVIDVDHEDDDNV